MKAELPEKAPESPPPPPLVLDTSTAESVEDEDGTLQRELHFPDTPEKQTAKPTLDEGPINLVPYSQWLSDESVSCYARDLVQSLC